MEVVLAVQKHLHPVRPPPGTVDHAMKSVVALVAIKIGRIMSKYLSRPLIVYSCFLKT